MLFQKISIFLYKTLGPSLSTALAISPFGKFVFRVLFLRKRIYKTKEGITLELEPKDALNYGIAFLGTINAFETAAFKKIVKKGDTFIDVGAYSDGWYSLIAAKLGARVYAFEPMPKYNTLLKKNIKRNNLPVTTVQMGISDKKGTVKFYDAGASSSIIQKQAEGHLKKTIKPITIKTITLDEFVAKNKLKVDIVKIDTEGADMKVLRGMTKLLKKSPILLIEVVDSQLRNADSSEKELIDFLRTYGYKVYMFTSSGLKPYKKEHGTNLLFKKV